MDGDETRRDDGESGEGGEGSARMHIGQAGVVRANGRGGRWVGEGGMGGGGLPWAGPYPYIYSSTYCLSLTHTIHFFFSKPPHFLRDPFYGTIVTLDSFDFF